jgi:hypothetical protein
MKIIVIYHRADFDGIFCREIARRFFTQAGVAAEYIGWDYGDPVPVVDADAVVYMLDISVEGLMDHPQLHWVDHHKSAIEKYPASIHGYRIDGVAACRLAWQYFGGIQEWQGKEAPVKGDFVDRRVSEPLAVRLAGEYDIWDKRDPRAELFQHGLRSRELTAGDWDQMLTVDRRASIAEVEALMDVGHQGMLEPDGSCPPAVVFGLLKDGALLQAAQERQDASVIRELGFTVEFEGLCFLACNAARYNSLLFNAGLEERHEGCLGFKWTGKDWSVSLYHAPGKEHHDLSTIAVKHGGGGHRGACGFRAATLPFLTGPG